MKRIGRDRFIRNVLVAIGNSGKPELAEEAQRLLDDDSPLVRGAAVWALSRLLAPEVCSRWRDNVPLPKPTQKSAASGLRARPA